MRSLCLCPFLGLKSKVLFKTLADASFPLEGVRNSLRMSKLSLQSEKRNPKKKADGMGSFKQPWPEPAVANFLLRARVPEFM